VSRKRPRMSGQATAVWKHVYPFRPAPCGPRKGRGHGEGTRAAARQRIELHTRRSRREAERCRSLVTKKNSFARCRAQPPPSNSLPQGEGGHCLCC
jgi:hypothetical protein